MRIFAAAAAYFALVFGVGFLLGPVRILLLVPRVGERAAELMELPVMLAVSVVAARFVVRRFRLARPAAVRLPVGGIALLLLLSAEFTLVVWLRGLSLGEYFATRDPVSGTAYYATLALFALLPWLLGRRG